MAAVRFEALDRCPSSPAHDVTDRGSRSLLRDRGQKIDMPSITEAANRQIPLISICICTYRRATQLEQLLNMLEQQVTKGLFRFSIVVVDNDAHQSAQSIVESCAERSSVPIGYRVEPQQNIAVARNASVVIATGDLVAFIDDDEEPSADW